MSEADPQRPADTDRNLLFGVLALQADLLDAAHFAQACAAWAARKDTSLADLLLELGWLTAEDRTSLEHLLQRRLQKHGGDLRASLAAALTPEARQALSLVEDADLSSAVASLPARASVPLPVTIAYQPESRDRYTLTNLHAQGGLGQVWLARDADLGRDVALKELRPDRADRPDLWVRFLEEAQITGQLEHPGIVPVYELVRSADGRKPFYTMRFVRGRTLSAAVRTYHANRQAGPTGPLDLRELLNAFVAVCNAVAYAHSRGVVHRDLKGSNVVLGDFGEVMVLDWGLAKVVQRPTDAGGAEASPAPPVRLSAEQPHDETREGAVLGTPAFMAPEQAEGRPDLVDARSDVYSLGAVLYEILTGRPPFTGTDTRDLLSKVIHERPVAPSRLQTATPRPLEAVCLKALAKRPEERYGSARELADEVRHWLADEPVAAYREPLTVRARRWLGRHRTLVTSGVAALVVAFVSLATATALLTQANERERQERDRARANFQLARDAVDRYCTKVSEDPRLKEKDLEELRRQLLQTAAEFYEQFVRQQDDPGVRAELGRAHRRLSGLVEMIVSRRQALAPCRRAIALFEELVAAEPGSAEYQDELAQSYNRLGGIHKDLHEFQPAAHAYQRAQDIWQKLTRDHPDQHEYAVSLGGMHCNFGLLAHMQANYPEAIDRDRQAIALLKAAHDRQPDEDRCINYLANSYESLANSQRLHRRPQEGVASSLEALPLRERLVKLHPGTPHYQSNLGRTLHILGLLYSEAGDPQRALETCEKALPIVAKLAGNHPNVTSDQRDLAILEGNLALFYRQRGELERARAALVRAQDIMGKLVARYPDVPDYQIVLFGNHNGQGVLLLSLGKFEESFQEFQKAEKAYRNTATQPQSSQRLAFLALNFSSLGKVSLRAGKQEQGAAALRRVEALLEKADLARARPAECRSLARALVNLGLWHSESGKHDRAVTALRQAIDLERRGGAATWGTGRDSHSGGVYQFSLNVTVDARLGADDGAVRDLPDMYARLGGVYLKQAQRREALDAWGQAVVEREKLLAEQPQEPRHPVALANDLLNLGKVYQQDGQPAKAADAFRKSSQALARRALPDLKRGHEASRALVQASLGDQWAGLGKRAEAEQAYRRARAAYEPLAARAPDVADYQDKLARLENNLAALAYKSRNYPEAIKGFRSAQGQLAELVRRHPKTLSYRISLANAQVNLGAALHEGGQRGDALEAYRQAVPLLEKLDPRDSQVTSYLEKLAGNGAKLARDLVGRRDFARAVESCNCSVAAARILATAYPGELRHRLGAARAHSALGAAQAHGGHLDQAAVALRQAEALLGNMDLKSPEVAQARSVCAGSLGALAVACATAGKAEQAGRAFDQARTLAEQAAAAVPSAAEPQRILASILIDLGAFASQQRRRDDALKAWRRGAEIRGRLAADHPQVTSYQVDLAGVQLRLGRILAEGGNLDDAAELYRQARVRLAPLPLIDPTVAQSLATLGAAYTHLGTSGQAFGKLSVAVRALRDGLTVWEKLTVAHPGRMEYAIELGAAQGSLGGLLWAARQPQAAQQLLDSAAHILDGALKADGANARARVARALTFMNQGILASMTGKTALAGDNLRQAVTLQEKLVADQPGESTHRLMLATMCGNLATFYGNTGKPEQAVAVSRKQLAVLQALPAPLAKQPPQRLELARAEVRLGSHLIEAGKFEEAGGAIAKARAVLAGLPAVSPAVTRERAEMANAYSRLASAFEKASPDRAAEAYRQAQAIQEQLVADYPRVADFAVSLGGTYCNTGTLAQLTGKPEAALAWYAKAVGTLKGVVDVDALNVRGRLFLRNSHWGRAQSLEQLQRYGDAVADWEQIVRLDNSAGRTGFVIRRARCLVHAGLHQRAAAAAEQLAGGDKGGDSRLYHAARVLALAAPAALRDGKLDAAEQKKLAEQYAQRAVALLRRAQAAGYFKDPAAVAQLRKEGDLESLRSRGDYKKLLDELNKR